MDAPTPADPAAARRKPRQGRRIGIAAIAALAAVSLPRLGTWLEVEVLTVAQAYAAWFEGLPAPPSLLVPGFALIGGLLASVSPCLLAMLPLNLAYIGASATASSRRGALGRVGAFVAGSVVVFSLFGLLASFAATVAVDQRGPVHLAVGTFILLMGLRLGGWLRLPLPQLPPAPPVGGPFLVGAGFALVSSPCASPVLFAVLAAAASTGSTALAVATMVAYALGYTAVIALAAAGVGLTALRRRGLGQGERLTRLSAAVLLLAGAWFLVEGLRSLGAVGS